MTTETKAPARPADAPAPPDPARLRARALELLREGQHVAYVRADDAPLRSLAEGFATAPAESLHVLPVTDEDARIRMRLVDYLRDHIGQQLQALSDLNRRTDEFRLRYARATDEQEQRDHTLAFARDLGASAAELERDRRAFERWFGADAVLGRALRCAAEHERRIVLVLDRIGALCRPLLTALSGSLSREDLRRCWRHLDLENALLPLFVHGGDSRVQAGDPRVRAAAFRCLGQSVSALPPDEQARAVGPDAFQASYRAAMDTRSPVWVAVEALRTTLPLAPQGLIEILVERLTRMPPEQDRDDLFVRRRAVRLLGYRLRNPVGLKPADISALADLLHGAADDPSPFVRQGMVQALTLARTPRTVPLLYRLAREDAAPQVRAAALLGCLDLVPHAPFAPACAETLRAALEHEADRFVLRTALRVAREGHRVLIETVREEDAQRWEARVTEMVERLHREAPDLAVRRWAGQTLERLWLQRSPERRALHAALAERLKGVPAGEAVDADDLQLEQHGAHTVGRILSLLAEDDHGFDVERNLAQPRVRRGHRFGFRLWRLIHEWRHPATDKRQAFRHTVGRVFRGRLRAPSAILSELSETKVPGEPLFLPSEHGWRPYLPLVDEALSSLSSGEPVRIYTSEGVTELRPPADWKARLRMFLRLSWHFVRYARLRNWREGDRQPPSGYIAALRELGFGVGFEPHADTPGAQPEPAVARFFPALVPLPVVEVWDRFAEYFVSLYQNTLRELFTFLVAMAALFLGRHFYANLQLRRARHAIPLVIGGWGSRGKSGTERLKAALINALGYNVVSKTTGCEAMFLHGYAYGPLREMFLFRPYDKASIWEQTFVMGVAQHLDTEVFLWECMGLTPSYVEILQRQWMRDDLSTLTNAYPDHEDIQGPAGINIPEVMTRFIPRDGILVTSEEQMLPILADAAAQLNTRVRCVGWLEAGLLTDDVLARFPYQEHPANVALVLGLAEELGLDPEFALKEIADRVVPDLGALKAYPAAPLRGRRLEYVLGNSANERHAALGNWVRMGFDREDPRREPGTYITTLVNNRADRVARSRVFASMLVNDTPADGHVLIGGNLDGLYAFIREEWALRMGTTTLWPKDGQAREILEKEALRLRVPVASADVSARLRAMLGGLSPELPVDRLSDAWGDPASLSAALSGAGIEPPLIEAVVQHTARFAGEFRDFDAFARKVDAAGAPDPSLDKEFRELLWKWFSDRIHVIHDYHATGNQIVERLCELTPPGCRNRIMGMQNIKGTGLGHVYTWEAWEACHRACALLADRRVETVDKGLQALTEFQEYNLLCEEHLRRTLDEFRHTDLAQSERVQAQVAVIDAQFQEGLRRARSETGAQRKRGRLASLCDHVEAFLDAGDAVTRRKEANRIYKDLADERVSHVRAALELQKLNKRQKGGWLWERVEKFLKPALETK